MARGDVQGGGDFFDYAAAAESEPLVMFRKREQLADRDLGNGPTSCVLADVLFITGEHEGTALFGEELIGRGMTNELVRQNNGDDLPCKLIQKKRGSNAYAAIVKCSEAELATIDSVMPPDKEDEVWAELREAQVAANNSGGNGSAPSADAPQARRKPWADKK